jgi:two-component system, cell cycle sensor histidine kinase and response regulator CckA
MASSDYNTLEDYILIVDDNPENLHLLSRVLTPKGYQVLPTTNGLQALAAVQSLPPTLILLDIMMPGMDGYEVCRRLKASDVSRDIPVIFISALHENDDKLQAFAVGGVDYITRPFHAPEVLARVKTHLALRHTQKQLHEANEALRQYQDHLEKLVEEQTADLRREIAERERAETALRESEERYRRMFQAASVSLWEEDISRLKGMLVELKQQGVQDLNAYLASHPDFIYRAIQAIRVVDVNEMTLQIYQAPHKEALLGSLDKTMAPEALPVFRDHIIAIAEQKPYFESESYACTLQGRTINILLRATTPPARAGFETMLVSIMDITERKRLEEQLRQSQKMEAIGRLAGGVAHDFNNLLTSMLGHTALALETLPADDPARSDIQMVQRSAERAADLTFQLLAFARRQLIEPKLLNLNELILNIHKMLRRLIGENIELVILPAPELGWIKADPGQLEQVLLNLSLNARDAMPNGGKLVIETANVTLNQAQFWEHSEISPGEYVVLSVIDTGTGMSEAVKARIFEPFFTTKAEGRGTGLGLATCFGIVKQNNGHIWLSSEEDKGTTFRVYLPRVMAVGKPLAPPAEVMGLPQGTETILLVEDDALVRSLAVRVLHQQGYHLLEAANGHEALAFIQQYDKEIQLLISDLVMPGISGKALAEQLQAVHPQIKVLFISGYTDHIISHHGVLESGVHFLQKPFLPVKLARKVREVLDEALA